MQEAARKNSAETDNRIQVRKRLLVVLNLTLKCCYRSPANNLISWQRLVATTGARH